MLTTIALISAALHIVIAGFQLFLAAGKPWGEYAWGGQHPGVLPPAFRMGSAISIVILLCFALVNLHVAGLVSVPAGGFPLARVQWVVTIYAGLGTVMNAISRSHKERLLWTPVAAALLVLNILILRQM